MEKSKSTKKKNSAPQKQTNNIEPVCEEFSYESEVKENIVAKNTEESVINEALLEKEPKLDDGELDEFNFYNVKHNSPSTKSSKPSGKKSSTAKKETKEQIETKPNKIATENKEQIKIEDEVATENKNIETTEKEQEFTFNWDEVNNLNNPNVAEEVNSADEKKLLKQQKLEEKLKLKEEKKKLKQEEKEKLNGAKNSYIYGFIFIIASILLEVSNLVRLGLGILPTNFALELAVIIMLAGIIFIVPSEPAKISVMSILFGIQLIMNIANASLYKMMYDLITVDMIFTLGFETADAFEFNQLDLTSLITSGIILTLFVLAIIFGSKYAPRFRLRKGKRAIMSLLALVFSIEMLGYGLFTTTKYLYFNNTAKAEYLFENNEYSYSTLATKFASMKQYGFWNFYINNASIFFNYEKQINKNEMNQLTETVNAGKNYKYLNSTFNGNNVSGALSDNNLIVIMMESVEWFAIDPYNTPTLYEFIEEDAIKFENYCARNKTNLSEEISFLGSIPTEYSFTTINNNVGINTPYSLPNLLKNSGIETANFFHDYTGEMYDRSTLNKAFGFDNVYTMEECNIQNKSNYFGDFLDDGDFVKAYKNEFMPSDKSFFSFFTTVTTHGPYDKQNERYTNYYNKFETNYDKYVKFVNDNNLGYNLPEKNTEEYKILKEYKSKSMAVENMINVILNHLKTTKNNNNEYLINNTSIVLYADHNAYYSNLCYNMKNLNQYANDKNLYNIPFVIYNKNLPNAKVTTFCNTYDIFPTICDLYGLEFNSALTQGYSVFSEDISKSTFVSAMCGIFNDDFYTVTFDDITAKDNSINTNIKLTDFKNNINTFLQKQQNIEKYYRINYEKISLNN